MSNDAVAASSSSQDMTSTRDQTNDTSGGSATGSDDVQALTASVGKLSTSDLWASLDSDLNTKSGKLHGAWAFDGILSNERPHGRFLSYYGGTGMQNDAGWIGEAYGTGHTNHVEMKKPDDKKNAKKHPRRRE